MIKCALHQVLYAVPNLHYYILSIGYFIFTTIYTLIFYCELCGCPTNFGHPYIPLRVIWVSEFQTLLYWIWVPTLTFPVEKPRLSAERYLLFTLVRSENRIYELRSERHLLCDYAIEIHRYLIYTR